jgi:hypothetical protein
MSQQRAYATHPDMDTLDIPWKDKVQGKVWMAN